MALRSAAAACSASSPGSASCTAEIRAWSRSIRSSISARFPRVSSISVVTASRSSAIRWLAARADCWSTSLRSSARTAAAKTCRASSSSSWATDRSVEMPLDVTLCHLSSGASLVDQRGRHGSALGPDPPAGRRETVTVSGDDDEVGSGQGQIDGLGPSPRRAVGAVQQPVENALELGATRAADPRSDMVAYGLGPQRGGIEVPLHVGEDVEIDIGHRHPRRHPRRHRHRRRQRR